MGNHNNGILTGSQLKKLTEHKYSASGSTLMDPLMQKFWNSFVTKVPPWVAPNLMTVVGLIVNVTTSLILVFYSPDGKQNIPSWALLLFAIGLFIYQTLDACDGKQARRTNSSSPLGELFDHGCDSLSTVFVCIAACVAVQLGSHPGWMFYQCIAASTLFYTAHWQTYVSGTLRFGKFDVTEAQFSIMLMHIISAVFGTDIWSSKVPLLECELKILVCYSIMISLSLTMYTNLTVIFNGGCGKNGSTVAIPWLNCEMRIVPVLIAGITHIFMTFRNLTIILSGGIGKNGSTVAGTSVISPFIPIAVVVIPAFIIYQKSPTQLFENHPCLYLLTFGLVIAKVTNKLVVAHMTKSEMDYLDSALIGPAMLFLNQYFNSFIDEYYVLWAALIYTVYDLLRYGTVVCKQIAGHFQIYVFSLKQGSPGNTNRSDKTSNKTSLSHTSSSNDHLSSESSELLLPNDENSEDDDEEILLDKVTISKD